MQPKSKIVGQYSGVVQPGVSSVLCESCAQFQSSIWGKTRGVNICGATSDEDSVSACRSSSATCFRFLRLIYKFFILRELAEENQ